MFDQASAGVNKKNLKQNYVKIWGSTIVNLDG